VLDRDVEVGDLIRLPICIDTWHCSWLGDDTVRGCAYRMYCIAFAESACLQTTEVIPVEATEYRVRG
jgi:hypothetical protein